MDEIKEIPLNEEAFAMESLQNFLIHFPSENECLQAFPAVCKACELLNESDERCFVCTKCKTKTWRTADTYFRGLRMLLPTLAWIWLAEDRASISVKKFAEIFGISYADAWSTNAKVKAVLEEEMNKHDAFEVVSKTFDSAICKRTIQSLAGKHPNYEEDDDAEPDLEELEEMDSDQQIVYAELKSQPIHFDVLYQRSGLSIAKFGAALAMLDMNGTVQQHIGNQFSLKKTSPTIPVSSDEMDAIRRFHMYVRKTFHGVSRKYIQRYLAAFWTRWGVDRWTKQTLFKTILMYVRPSRADILAYHSPQKLRIPVLRSH